MGAEAAGVAGAGTIVNAYAAYKAQQAENKRLEFQAQIAEYNAGVAEIEGRLSKEAFYRDEQEHRRSVEDFVSSQKAVYSASGVKTSTGSALRVQETTMTLGAKDAMAIRYRGDIAEFKGKMTAEGLRMQAEAYRSGKGSASEAATLALLGGGAQTYNAYER